MHELAVTQSILAIVLEKARKVKAQRISEVDLLLGRLTGYIPECIELQFKILSRDTEAAGASLVFHQPPARLHCRKCDVVFESEVFDLTCPGCHTIEVDILSGAELRVETIEIE
jgi:hydrogenase nickel incorporation protein HypA/HybF